MIHSLSPLLRSVFSRLAFIPLLVSCAGCAGYRLGSTLPEGVASVFVPVVVNETTEPGLETAATSATVEEIQLDGSLKIAAKEQADSVLEIRLKRYTLTPLRYRKDQTATAQEYRLTLIASAVLRRASNNEVLYKSDSVSGFATFDALADLPSARRNALPAAAKDLAHRIVRSVTGYWQ